VLVMELDVSKSRTLTLRIPRSLDSLIEKACKDLNYVNKSDFIRDAISEYIGVLTNELKSRNEFKMPKNGFGVRVRKANVVLVY